MTALPQSSSPEGLKFGPRRKSFEIEAALATDWHGGSAFRTAWFNAMSMLFPLGEKFFIESVRHFADDIENPKLLEEISAFQAQEATHRRQHQRYNEILCESRGYDLDRIERNERERIDWAYRELSARRRLAGTTASEHLTAILADEMLTRKAPMAGADPVIASLWLWHGIEETEHKAVAFDVHVAVGGPVRERRHALILNTFFFLKDTMRNLCIMLQTDGKLWSLREWGSGFYYLFIKPGVLRRIFVPWLRFLGRGFHPWQHDNRHLIEAWEQKQLAADTPGMAAVPQRPDTHP